MGGEIQGAARTEHDRGVVHREVDQCRELLQPSSGTVSVMLVRRLIAVLFALATFAPSVVAQAKVAGVPIEDVLIRA